MLTFNHSGKIGDLLYSLYFCRALSKMVGDEKFNFHIQTYAPQTLYGRERDIPRLDDQKAEYIASLLRGQKIINEVTISKEFNIEDYQKGINLDKFREIPLNFSNGYIAEWYYSLVNFPLDRNYSECLIDVTPNPDFKDKIVVLQTKKYINPFVDLKVLKPWEDRMIFIGLEDEYEIFKKRSNIEIPLYKVKNGLEAAQALKGAKLVVSNQNGNFAIAEMIKANRLLIPAQYELVGEKHDKLEQGPVNVVCHGGWYEYANLTKKLRDILQLIFKTK